MAGRQSKTSSSAAKYPAVNDFGVFLLSCMPLPYQSPPLEHSVNDSSRSQTWLLIPVFPPAGIQQVSTNARMT